MTAGGRIDAQRAAPRRSSAERGSLISPGSKGHSSALPRLPAVATDYVVEKLVVAVEALAVSAAPIQQRVRDAWRGALVHLRPDDFDDPRERALFTNIRDAVTARGGVVATTDSMSDGQALSAAGELVELLGTISLTLAVEREPSAGAE
jgi:hypothetical protein